MALSLRRADLQNVASGKIDDAQFLLKHRRYSNAYYLAGYAVEIGLKACISRQFGAEAIPDRSLVNAVFSHNLRTLVHLAGLTNELKDRELAQPEFAANWALVSNWNPDVRYELVDRRLAQIFIKAVGDEGAGVLPWIQVYW